MVRLLTCSIARTARGIAPAVPLTSARRLLLATAIASLGLGGTVAAEDWPEFRGKGRLGVWTETGIVEKFPEGGLPVLWRTPIKAGFSGPAVSEGRVFLLDFEETQKPKGIERALALDEKTGAVLWTQSWEVDYRGMSYGYGPRTTPTVDGDRVYVAGADGKLLCLDTKTGAIIWKKDYVADFGADRSKWAFDWGFSSAPLVDGNRLIALVGGKESAKVVAFDKATGKEVWRALGGDTELGVAQPIIVTAGGARQLIIWYPGAVVSLNPETGIRYWEQPYKTGASMTVATPVINGPYLFFTNFYDGPLMLELDAKAPKASVVWKGKSDSEIQTDGLHSTVNTPVLIGDYIYGICSYGQFRCIYSKTGERVWETQVVTKERARWASGIMVRHGDRLFINNDRGELVLVQPSPEGYKEISRTALIKPTTNPGNRRQLGAVNWTQPAYANRHIYVRNDEEIICVSLATDGK